MKIFDSKSGGKVEFEPLEKGKIGMYVCGPTVYDLAHLGHGRSAVNFDVIRRYFLYKGFDVLYVSNYTDIDDKMINRAKDEGIAVEALANKIIPEYEKDYGALGVIVPDRQPKATQYIEVMIELIERLEKEDYTYVLDDGVYYDVSRFADYGRLSGQDLDALEMGARVDVKDAKRNPQDFVLWKFKKKGEPFWKSPWGAGRPGWHIECSAMTYNCLGVAFDIHGGGLDLKFPHHECEVAQSVGVFGKDGFAKYWMHNGFINVDNEKMSKSLGNFFTLRDVFKKYDPMVVRFMFLQTHYRNPVNFSDTLLEQAKAGLERIHDFVRMLKHGFKNLVEGSENQETWGKLCEMDFQKAMDDDFNTSKALDAVSRLIRHINSMSTTGTLNIEQVKDAEDFLRSADKVFGVIFHEQKDLSDKEKELIQQREKARKDKDFKKSDELRDELKKLGIELDDTAKGTIWKRT